MSAIDNVAVVTGNVSKEGMVRVGDREYRALCDVPAGHKIAVSNIAAGSNIIKYGKTIGRASEDIRAGEWVHCHNVTDITAEISRRYAEHYRNAASTEA